MQSIRILAVLGVFLIVPLSVAGASRQNRTRQLDQRGTQQQPIIIKTIPNTEELRRDAEHTKERAEDVAVSRHAVEEREQNDKTAGRISWFTLIILIVQAGAFIYQALEMKKSVEAMKEATDVAKEAADKAKTSADAAVAANELNRDALLADQRPWVAITDAPRIDFSRSGPGRQWQLTITVPLQNTGRTPAHNVRLVGQLLLPGEKNDIEPLHLAFYAEARRGSVGSTAQICFPGRPLNVVGEIPVDIDFQRSPLPNFFVLSGCVYYNGFPQEEKTLHATTLLYKIHVRQTDAKTAWVDPVSTTIAYDRFGVTTLPYGWIAD